MINLDITLTHNDKHVLGMIDFEGRNDNSQDVKLTKQKEQTNEVL